MPHDFSLSRVRDLCRDITREYLPHEMSLFDVVWPSFSEYVEQQLSMPDAKRVVIGVQPPQVVARVGAIGHGDASQLDLLYVFSVMTNVGLSLSRMKDLSQDLIVHTLSEELSRGDLPEYIRSTLGQHAGGMLCSLYGITVEPAAPAVEVSEKRFWVEWYDKYVSPDDDDGNIVPDQKPLTQAQIENKLRKVHKKKYVLYVNEVRGGQVLVKGKNVTLKLHKQPRARGFLYVVLCAFAHGRVLSRESIVDKALARPRGAIGEEDNIRKAKEAFVKLTDRELDQYIEPRGDGSYTIQGQVPYCWIRPNTKDSWLPNARVPRED